LNEQVSRSKGEFMMAARRLIKRTVLVMLEAAGLVSCFAIPFSAVLSVSASSLPVKSESSNRAALHKADQSAIEAYNKLPLSFETRPNNSTAKFVSRSNGYNFYLSLTEAIFQLQAGQGARRLSRGAALGSPRNAGSPSAVHKLPEPLRDEVASRPALPATTRTLPLIVKMKITGATPHASVVGVNELSRKSNCIIGNNPRECVELFRGED
jgi:hypothetical protein